MFYHITKTKTIDLHPKHFGPKLRDILKEKIISESEGTCDGKYGYIICVSSVIEISKGVIRTDGTGMATFNVTYTCVVYRPYKGEVIDCVVTLVNKLGFFAQAGPLQVFVSNHLIPEGYEYSTTGEAAYVCEETYAKIQEGAEVRLRVVGTKIDASEIFCVGSIKEDYLGIMGGP